MPKSKINYTHAVTDQEDKTTAESRAKGQLLNELNTLKANLEKQSSEMMKQIDKEDKSYRRKSEEYKESIEQEKKFSREKHEELDEQRTVTNAALKLLGYGINITQAQNIEKEKLEQIEKEFEVATKAKTDRLYKKIYEAIETNELIEIITNLINEINPEENLIKIGKKKEQLEKQVDEINQKIDGKYEHSQKDSENIEKKIKKDSQNLLIENAKLDERRTIANATLKWVGLGVYVTDTQNLNTKEFEESKKKDHKKIKENERSYKKFTSKQAKIIHNNEYIIESIEKIISLAEELNTLKTQSNDNKWQDQVRKDQKDPADVKKQAAKFQELIDTQKSHTKA